MRFFSFGQSSTGEPRLGLDAGDGYTVIDLAAWDPDNPAFTSMLALIDAGDDGLAAAREAYDSPKASAIVRSARMVLFAPLQPRALRDTSLINAHLRPSRSAVIRYLREQLGDPRSYEELAEALHNDMTKSGRFGYAMRDANLQTPPGGVLRRPDNDAILDYELEFGVVIGRGGRDITRADAAGHIFGYTIYNDWTLRDLQVRNSLAGKGVHGTAKDFPGGNTIGPCIVTADEIADPYDLEMTVRINGERWGGGNTGQAARSWEDAIVQISSEVEIQAGEVWGSGTVRSGSSFELGRRLPLAAYVELEIENLGVLGNYVVPA